MSKLFEGGIPVRPDVDILMKTFEPKAGDTISYDEIAAAINVEPKLNRFRTVTGSWRRQIFRELGLQTTAEGGRFFFLTADQAFDFGLKGMHKIGRAAGRLYVRSGTINVEEITQERREKFRLFVRETQAVVEAARSSVKKIAAPGPINSALRIAK